MKLISVCILFLTMAIVGGCSQKTLSDDEMLAMLQSSGYNIVKEGKIHHSLEGAQQAFWVNIDGKKVSAYKFSSVSKARLRGRLFKDGISSGNWAFEYADGVTGEKILKALKK